MASISHDKITWHRSTRLVVPAVVIMMTLTSCSTLTSPIQPSPSPSAEENNVGGVLSGGELSEQQWEEVLDQARQSVFKVIINTCGYEASGSGFFVGDTFVTNRHVVENAKTVVLESSTGKKIEAESWGQSNLSDLAWIKPKSSGFKLEVSGVPVQPGDLVANLGYPLGGDLTEERGRVVEFLADEGDGYSDGDLLAVTSEALPGNSGGPLLDRNGQVVGVVVALDLQLNLILAVPREDLKEFLSDLPKSKKVKPCN